MSDRVDSNFYCLVMAGGQGTRFWPESTVRRPKQYLELVSENSLLSETLSRFQGLIAQERRHIVTVKAQESLAAKASRGLIADKGLIFEPSGRNTAPCILLGLYSLLKRGATHEDVVIIVPSDHLIHDHQGFRETVKKASEAALSLNKIVTIGIPPSFPHTGFGYIHRGQELFEKTYQVSQFVEKPDLEMAKSYLVTGEYYWNAGMFTATIGVWLREFEKHAFEIYRYGEELGKSLGNFEKLSKVYGQIPCDSIDYAIMEKSGEVAVVPAEFDWNDLGSWDALEAVCKKKGHNTVASCRDFYFREAKGNIVYAPGKFVSLVGIEDFIVVVNDSSVVVLPKERSQEVKKIVEFIKSEKDLEDLL